MSSISKWRNKLCVETSPYLLQHKNNPVNWYPWGNEAINLAKQKNRLIFLSIGYSTCHWCHVMTHESFENEEIADFLNKKFVCIKVDREERPDIDRQYMLFVQATSGSGGWPLSVFLTPQLKPFFGGTYFTAKDEFGKPGFLSIIKLLASKWENDQRGILQSAETIYQALQTIIAYDKPSLEQNSPPRKISSRRLLKKAFIHFDQSFDPIYGGFGNTPKFPMPSALKFLTDYHFVDCNLQPLIDSLETMNHLQLTTIAFEHDISLIGIDSDLPNLSQILHRIKGELKERLTISKKAIAMVAATLQKLSNGGIFDHIGYGFHRYSVDKFFYVPHFEKMLYDQAQLASICIEVSNATKSPYYMHIADKIFHYVESRLITSKEECAFYTAEDADSFDTDEIKREGAYYIWTFNEIKRILGHNDESFRIFCDVFNVLPEGNISTNLHLKGKNVLHKISDLDAVSTKYSKDPHELSQIIQACVLLLRDARNLRPPPEVDDKIIVCWNALMISAYAKAFTFTSNLHYRRIASQSAEFIYRNMYDEGRNILYHSSTKKRDGFAEDYTFVISALIDLYEATFEEQWINVANTLQMKVNNVFSTEDNTGIFTTKRGCPGILFRIKEEYDGAEPSSNSVNVMNLLRLSKILEDPSHEEKALKILYYYLTKLNENPESMVALLSALIYHLNPPTTIIICGYISSDESIKNVLRFLRDNYYNSSNFLIICADKDDSEEGYLIKANPSIKELMRKTVNGKAVMQICKKYQCFVCDCTIEEILHVLGPFSNNNTNTAPPSYQA